MVDAMQRVLSSPELVSEILQYSENASCLFVNKIWSNEYLTFAWREVHHPSPLFKLLAPLKIDEDGLSRFSRSFQLDGRARFDSYAWRVKQLDMHVSADTFHRSVFDQLRAGRGNRPLFPTLQDLECPADPTVLRVFACPSITSLGMYLPKRDDCNVIAVASAFSSIPTSMPHVSYLYISSTFADELGIESEHLTTSIPMALSEMKELEELHLPPPWLTPCLTKVLASLPVLASINTLDVTDTVDPPLASPAQLLGPDDYPSLSKLELGITLDHALSWFQRCSSTRLLTHLTLFSAEPESKAAYASIIQIISDNMASRLEYLTLLIREFVDPPLDLSTIHFADLKPLLACRKLETLNLEFPFPFDIDVEDVISIVESLPSLKELHLNPRPSLTLHHKPSLHISCLSTLAHSSFSLQSIGLYVDTSSDKLPSESEDVSLPNLKNLDLGKSSLSPSSTKAIAAYFNRILPKHCRLSTWPGVFIHDEWYTVVSLLAQWRDQF